MPDKITFYIDDRNYEFINDILSRYALGYDLEIKYDKLNTYRGVFRIAYTSWTHSEIKTIVDVLKTANEVLIGG